MKIRINRNVWTGFLIGIFLTGCEVYFQSPDGRFRASFSWNGESFESSSSSFKKGMPLIYTVENISGYPQKILSQPGMGSLEFRLYRDEEYLLNIFATPSLPAEYWLDQDEILTFCGMIDLSSFSHTLKEIDHLRILAVPHFSNDRGMPFSIRELRLPY